PHPPSGAPDAATQKGDAVALLLTPDGRVVQQQAAGRLSSKVPLREVMQTVCAVAQSRGRMTRERGLFLTTPAGTSKDGRFRFITRPGYFRFAGMPLPPRHGAAVLLAVGIRSEVRRQMAALARILESVAPLILVL